MVKDYYLKLINFHIESMFLRFEIYSKNEINHLFTYDGDLFIKSNKLFELSDLYQLKNIDISYLMKTISHDPKDYYIDLNRVYKGPLSMSIDSIDDYIDYIYDANMITSDVYRFEKLKAIYYFDFIIKEFIKRQ